LFCTTIHLVTQPMSYDTSCSEYPCCPPRASTAPSSIHRSPCPHPTVAMFARRLSGHKCESGQLPLSPQTALGDRDHEGEHCFHGSLIHSCLRIDTYFDRALTYSTRWYAYTRLARIFLIRNFALQLNAVPRDHPIDMHTRNWEFCALLWLLLLLLGSGPSEHHQAQGGLLRPPYSIFGDGTVHG